MYASTHSKYQIAILIHLKNDCSYSHSGVCLYPVFGLFALQARYSENDENDAIVTWHCSNVSMTAYTASSMKALFRNIHPKRIISYTGHWPY